MRGFIPFFLLGRAAVFGHERNNDQDCTRAGRPCRERGDGREEPTIQLHNSWRGRRSMRSEISSSGKVEVWVGTTRSGVVGLTRRGFDTRRCFLLWLTSIQVSGCCRFRFGLLGPSRLPGGGHFRQCLRLRDRLRGIRNWKCSGGGLDNTFPVGLRVSTPRPSPSSRQRNQPAEHSELRSGMCWRFRVDVLHGRLRLLPLNIDPIVSCVVSPASTGMRLLPRARAPPENAGDPTREATGRVSVVSPRVSEALAALTFPQFLWSHVRFRRHSHAVEFADLSHFRHLRASRHRDNEVGEGGRTWSRRPERSCVTPW